MLNNERNGRPILIGTANVKMSEAIVSRLREAGVEPQLLNARPESIARENETISQAGDTDLFGGGSGLTRSYGCVYIHISYVCVRIWNNANIGLNN